MAWRGSARILAKSGLLLGVSVAACVGAAAAAEQTKTFDIPAQAAATGIQEFAREANVQILVSADEVQGKKSNPVHGSLSVHDGLTRLLNGTGVMIVSDDGKTIVLASAQAAAGSPAGSPPVSAAPPQPPREMPPATVAEQVLVTGSLIRGTQSVGATVTEVGQQDFKDTGAITVTDVLKSVPSIYIQPSNSAAVQGGNELRTQSLNIENLGPLRTLMLIDGMQFPLQNQNASKRDPSIIPQLALDRVDVLADGASATYGADAVAGVVNVILKRGFDGAVTQVQVGSADGGAFSIQATQLVGRTWDTGDITVTFQNYQVSPLNGSARDYYTNNFVPFGFDDEISIKSAIPGIVSTGAPSASTGTACTNCFSVPKGSGTNFVNGATPTPPVTWTQLLNNAGTQNEVDGYKISQIINGQQSNSAAATFDQEIIPGIEFFGEGFYANRRVKVISPVTITPFNTLSIVTVSVPTSNPYYPTGAPSNLRVSYDFAPELEPISDGHELSERFAGGFNVDLPFDWKGKLFASLNQENNQYDEENSPNINNISAALGYTVAGTPTNGATVGTVSFVKPSNIPYLNLFCDPTAFQCNSPATLNYLVGLDVSDSTYQVEQYGANFDGPLFMLPGGEVKAAVGSSYSIDDYFFDTQRARNAPQASIVQVVPDHEARSEWAAFTQVNIPIFGDANAIPFFHKLEVEGGYRYDHYSDFGGTWNPKIAVDWEPVEDLKFRGSWGTSFRAPTLADISPVAARSLSGLNILGGSTSNTLPLCQTLNTSAAPGSAAAALNPNCLSGLNSPGVLEVQGGANGLQGITRPANYHLQPETGRELNLGFDYTPQNFLQGLEISATWYNIDIANTIVALTPTNVPNILSSAAYRSSVLVSTDPGFSAALAALLALPQGSAISTATASNISVIVDSASLNSGYLRQEGMDFTTSYAWDMGRFGDWNAGVVGSYKFHQISALNGAAPTDLYAPEQPLAFRMTYRAHLGWDSGGYSATLFMDYSSHVSSTDPLPPLIYQSEFVNCQAGAEFQACANRVPAQYLFDISLGYNTRDEPANAYLKNLNLRLVVNNIFNRSPPFTYNISSSSNGLVGYLPTLYSPYGRVISLSLTKSW